MPKIAILPRIHTPLKVRKQITYFDVTYRLRLRRLECATLFPRWEQSGLGYWKLSPLEHPVPQSSAPFPTSPSDQHRPQKGTALRQFAPGQPRPQHQSRTPRVSRKLKSEKSRNSRQESKLLRNSSAIYKTYGCIGISLYDTTCSSNEPFPFAMEETGGGQMSAKCLH